MRDADWFDDPEAVTDDRAVYAVVRNERTAGELRELLGALEIAAAGRDEAQEIMRRHGFVIDKWPPANIPRGDDGFAAWTAETVAALDPEVRWQGLAFTLYTILAQITDRAERASLDDGTQRGLGLPA